MNYYKYIPIDVVNGPGTRCTLFVCGCEHHCRGCYNQATWPFDAGFLFGEDQEDRIISDLNDRRIHRRGLSLSGGEPLHPRNVPALLHLVRRIRVECSPQKDIWLWSGFVLDELNAEQRQLVDLVDVMIDGKFVEELKDPKLDWRGSSNQVIHEFDRSNAWWKKQG